MAASSKELHISTLNDSRVIFGETLIKISIPEKDSKLSVILQGNLWRPSEANTSTPNKLTHHVSFHHTITYPEIAHYLKISFKVNDLAACLHTEPHEIESAYLLGNLKDFIYDRLNSPIIEKKKKTPGLLKMRQAFGSMAKLWQGVKMPGILSFSKPARSYVMLTDNMEIILDKYYEIFKLTVDDYYRIADNFFKLKPTLKGLPRHFSKRVTMLPRSFVYFPVQDEMYILLKDKSKNIEDIGQGGFNRVSFALSLHGNLCAFRSAKKNEVPPTEIKINQILSEDPRHFVAGPSVEYHGNWRERSATPGDSPPKPQVFTDKIGFIVDFKSGGDLFSKIKELQRLPNPKAQILSLACQMAEILSVLHDKYSIVHLDLKPENLLLDGDWNVYLGDFGLSAFVDDNIEPRGTLHYIDPSMLLHHKLLAKPYHDIWSLGIIFYILWSDNYSNLLDSLDSYANLSESHFFEEGFEELKEEELPERKNIHSFHWIIDQCLQVDPLKRPTAGYLLNTLKEIIIPSSKLFG